MADVKLTPRQTSRLLMHLDESVRQLTQVRDQLIEAMAQRQVKRDKAAPKGTGTPRGSR